VRSEKLKPPFMEGSPRK